MSFFPLPHFSYCVDCKGLNTFCILTRQYAIFTFLDKLAYIIKKKNLSATLIIMLTTKCKTNLILDKTNKINSLKLNIFFFADLIFLFVISFSFSSGSLILRFWKLDIFSGNSRVRKNKNLFYFAL